MKSYVTLALAALAACGSPKVIEKTPAAYSHENEKRLPSKIGDKCYKEQERKATLVPMEPNDRFSVYMVECIDGTWRQNTKGVYFATRLGSGKMCIAFYGAGNCLLDGLPPEPTPNPNIQELTRDPKTGEYGTVLEIRIPPKPKKQK
ncbi:MAG TPA: hypothetical protein VI968_01015 [archaeon]|nr:hypothetical protein [archaeon]